MKMQYETLPALLYKALSRDNKYEKTTESKNNLSQDQSVAKLFFFFFVC